MTWYYADSGNRIGPVSESTLDILVKAGTVTDGTLVWREGMAEWLPYAQARPEKPAPRPPEARAAGPSPGPAGAAAPAERQACNICGKEFPADALIRFRDSLVCADCKPLFVQRLQEGAAIPGTLVYAGFWKRVGAKLIDNVILWIAGTVINLLATPFLAPLMAGAGGGTPAPGVFGRLLAVQGVLTVVNIVIACTYTTWFVGKRGATPGKMALGLKVVTPEGGTVTYGRAFGRYFAEILSALILAIGYIMVAFDNEKRALHDRICHTRVVIA